MRIWGALGLFGNARARYEKKKKKIYWDQFIVSMDVNPHTKNIKFAPQLFFEIFFWIIILKCFQQPWASWLCLFETPEQIYYSHGYLTIFKKLTLCLYSLTYYKVIILKYFFHAQTYLNKHKLNIGINLCFNKSPATPKINFIPKIILNWASKKPGIWLFGNILGHNLNQELSHAWD